MTVLDFTPEERASGRMAAAKRDAALAALREDGFVVLKDIIDRAHLEILKSRMLEDVNAILAREDAPFNFNAGNVQQDPPPMREYLFRDVLVNDLVIQVTGAMLGPGVRNGYYSGNTALPGGPRQPVHPDSGQLWPNLEQATPAYGLVVNVPVVDMSPENGSTEIWPGTHHDTTFTIHEGAPRVTEALLAKRRAVCPPLQPTVSQGSVLIRDIRLWHAGMPNRTATPRPMIAMIHWCSWVSLGEPLEFPKAAEAIFEHPTLSTHARFVDGPIAYLQRHGAHDLQK